MNWVKDASTCSGNVFICEHINYMVCNGFKIYLSNTGPDYNFHSHSTAVGHK